MILYSKVGKKHLQKQNLIKKSKSYAHIVIDGVM